jgi:NADH:ubiquinone oxidoreductase subunit K
MSWKFYLVLVGMIMIAIAAVVEALHQNLGQELLATGLLLGAIAIALVAANIPNGKDK